MHKGSGQQVKRMQSPIIQDHLSSFRLSEEIKYPIMRSTRMSEMSKTINMSALTSNLGSPKVTNRSVFIAKMRDKLKLKSSLH